MTSYEWPTQGRRGGGDDDAAARIAFTSRRRLDFDLEGALAAGRLAPAPPRDRGRPGGPAAPGTGPTDLWLPLGPANMFASLDDNRQRNAGRVKMLAAHPTDGRVYAAAANGGVWFSPDAGDTWTALGGFAATANTEIDRPAQRHASGAIFVDFKATAAADIVYIGTGEPSHTPTGQPGVPLGGIGVLVATGPVTAVANGNPWVREAPGLLGFGCSRFAQQPGGSTLVVATTAGLFQRPAVGGLDAVWTKVAGVPFATLTADCTDVLWTSGLGTRPERLWVWVKGGPQAGLWVRTGPAVDFTRVATPGALRSRSVLAASTPADQIFVLNDQGNGPAPALYRVACAAPTLPVATRVTGVPKFVGKQGFYDMSIAVHPTQPNHVVMAGSVCNHVTDTVPPQAIGRFGAILGGDVSAGSAPALGAVKTLGVGVHADVHHLAYANAGNRLWASCDGGVYRSDHPTKVAGFIPRNNGLAVAESNYVACHPMAEGYLVAGLQDNGVIERGSNGVWTETAVGGDGGGVVLDPLRPDRFLRQGSGIEWSTSDGTLLWNFLANLPEQDASGLPKVAFYSTPAAIGHRRGVVAPAAPNVAQVIFGTHRLWYTENFGATLKLLPSGTAAAAAGPTDDAFGEPITVCRWQHPDVAWILGEGRLERYVRTAGTDTAATPGAWTRELILRKGVKNKKDTTSADGPVRESAVWTDIALNLDPDTDGDGFGEIRGTKGAVYLGTVGNKDNEDVDTLWWFNGIDRWFPTQLRTQRPGGVPAPVTAIACDAAHPEEVWVGTTVGVWHGIRTLNGTTNPPTWAWEPRNHGLPEAAVEDLAIFSHDGLRLLRAAIAARGLWELRLDGANVDDLTYVRAHNDDLRYRARAISIKRDMVTPRSWHGSPDVRPRRAPASVPPPSSLPWTRGDVNIRPELLRRFQAALRSRSGDPRVRPNGVWDAYFNEVLRDLGAPALAAPPFTVRLTSAFWTTTMGAPHGTAEAWSTPVPTEAELVDLTPALVEGLATKTSCILPARAAKVEVVVHHRGLAAIDGANVLVTLLRWMDPKPVRTARWFNPATWTTGRATDQHVTWTPAVNQLLNTGASALPLGPGWAYAGSTVANRLRILTGQTLDNLHSGIASFDLDLTGLPNGRVVLLAAVVRAGPAALALTSATLQDLALTSPNVAVRSVRIRT